MALGVCTIYHRKKGRCCIASGVFSVPSRVKHVQCYELWKILPSCNVSICRVGTSMKLNQRRALLFVGPARMSIGKRPWWAGCNKAMTQTRFGCMMLAAGSSAVGIIYIFFFKEGEWQINLIEGTSYSTAVGGVMKCGVWRGKWEWEYRCGHGRGRSGTEQVNTRIKRMGSPRASRLGRG